MHRNTKEERKARRERKLLDKQICHYRDHPRDSKDKDHARKVARQALRAFIG